MSKMKIVNFDDNVNPQFSLTATKKKDVYAVYGEESGTDFGTVHKSRLLSLGWTNKQLEYVKEHGTTNFVQVKK